MVGTLTDQKPDLVLTPWQARLYAGIASARHEVLIASPYIKLGIAAKIRGASCDPNVKFRTVTRFKETDFAAGACDVDAVWALSQIGGGPRYEAKYNNTLHAKIYIIDAKVAYLGSSNLTFSGLMRNQEACVHFKDNEFVQVLRMHFLALWEEAESLSRESFAAMIAALSSARALPPREKEHFYLTEKRMDFFGTDKATRSESSIEYVSSYPDDLASRVFQTLASISTTKDTSELASEPNSPPAPTSPAWSLREVARITDKTTAAASGEAENMPVELEDVNDRAGASPAGDTTGLQEEALRQQQISERIAAQHAFANRLDEAAGIFFRTLNRRFDLRTDGLSNLYVLVICGPDLWDRLKARPEDPNPFVGNHVNFEELRNGKNRHRALALAGRSVFNCACFSAAQKAGLIGRFGSQIVFLLATNAYRQKLLANYWYQNFLGPLFVAKEDDVRTADLNEAALMLLGAVSMAEGLEKALDLAEEFFNPLDPVGENIVDVRLLKDAKTFLQEIATASGRLRPSYQCSFAGGPPHKPVWNCEVVVGDTIRASAAGSSKGEAEMSAASSALDKMQGLKGWGRIMDRVREEALVRFSSEARYAIRPKREMSSEMQAHVRKIFKDRLGIEADPEYVMLALRAPLAEDQRPGWHSYDNRPLASLGMILSEWLVLREVWEIESVQDIGGLLSSATAAMPEVLDVSGIRQQLGLSVAISAAQRLDVAQAIVAAIYMSTEANEFRTILSEPVGRLVAFATNAFMRTQGARTERGRTEIVGRPFDPALSYTTFLQEETQRQKKKLPTVSYITTGPTNLAMHQATVEFEEFKTRASAASRTEARNKASFELLRQLYERDEAAKASAIGSSLE